MFSAAGWAVVATLSRASRATLQRVLCAKRGCTQEPRNTHAARHALALALAGPTRVLQFSKC
eukprot:15432982-Alexandrium_andersonii.AAC.1